MATTANYGWTTPDDTGYVKDGALAIRTLGNAIDTTVDSIDDRVDTLEANDIPKTLIDAKGDLLAGTAADTISRLAVGTNGQVLTADSSTATGLKWASASSASSGMTFISGQTVSGASSVIFNDVFSSTYENYVIYVRVTGSGGAVPIGIRLRVSGSDAATNYAYQNLQVDGTSVAGAKFTAQTELPLFSVSNTTLTVARLEIFRPFEAASTGMMGTQGFETSSNPILTTRVGGHSTATSYSGISFIPSSGHISGTIRIYGLQNS